MPATGPARMCTADPAPAPRPDSDASIGPAPRRSTALRLLSGGRSMRPEIALLRPLGVVIGAMRRRHGIGIAEQDLARMFGPVEQLDGRREGRRHGPPPRHQPRPARDSWGGDFSVESTPPARGSKRESHTRVLRAVLPIAANQGPPDSDRVGGWAACRAPSRPQHGIARWEPLKTSERA